MSFLYAGYDPHYQFQLYHSDPSGNYSGWKATCIGANNGAFRCRVFVATPRVHAGTMLTGPRVGTAQSLLKQEYKDDISIDDAIGLVLRVMSKTMDSTTLGNEKRASSLTKVYSPFDTDLT